MAEFKLGRIKFVWQGDWSPATSYVVDDVINISGQSYICIKNHTSSSAFTTDLDEIPTNWNLVAGGTNWTGDWTTSTYYNQGDQVKYGGIVYICNTSHESAATAELGLEDDQNNWDAFASSLEWKDAWSTSTRYKVNDFVSYNGYTYICTSAHTSADNITDGLEIDAANWDIFNKGLHYTGEWTEDTRYIVNDIVKYGASSWICVTAHTSATSFNDTNFELFVEGLQFESDWDVATEYQIGDTVVYGGYSYIAKENNVGVTPSTATEEWEVYTTGFSFQSEWDTGTDYQVGDVVSHGGYSYLATTDSTGQTPPNDAYWSKLNEGTRFRDIPETYTDVSATTITGLGTGVIFDIVREKTSYNVTITNGGTGYASTDTVKILGSALGGLSPVNDLTITVSATTGGAITSVTTEGFSSTWTSLTSYILGDVVFFGASTYICIEAHDASSGNRPDVDTTATYWNLYAAGYEGSILTTAGDTYYYGENGPTRLPVGTDGQILRVKNGYPTWAYYGSIQNVVYVAPTGTDSSDTGWGESVDKPWKSVRYALDRVKDGYLNEDSKKLLEKNKLFLMKEVSNWITSTYSVAVSETSADTDQFTVTSTASLSANMPIEFDGTVGGVTAGTKYYVKTVDSDTTFTITDELGSAVLSLTTETASMTGTLSYDTVKCERDTGYLVDAVTYDISHGGNSKVVRAANAYYTPAGSAYITSNFSEQLSQTTSAYGYLKTLINNILSNQAPSVNYQSANSVSTPATQIIDTTLTSSTDVIAESEQLLDIVITGLIAGTSTAIPPATHPNTTMSVKTGTYYEVLPMIIPNYAAVVGDELRGTVINPNRAIDNLSTDRSKTTSALNRIKDLASDIVQNNLVTPTTGNTETQVTSLTAGSTGSTVAEERITRSANVIYDVVNNGLDSIPTEIITDPVGIDSDYVNARQKIEDNYDFIKADVTQFITNNYSGLTYDSAACERDVGYILDAVRYDVTYGGNIQSLIAGRSYYTYINLVIPAEETTATLAAYAHLATIIDDVAQNNSVTPQAGNTEPQDITGTGDTTGTAAAFAAARITDVYDWINDGETPAAILPDTSWVDAELVAGFTELISRKSEIESDGTAYVKKFFQTLVFNDDTCARDIGYMVEAIGYDAMFNSNFASTIVGKSYHRGISSAQLVLSSQKDASLGLIEFLKSKIKSVATGGGVSKITSTITDITNTINGGAVPRPLWPSYAGTATTSYAASQLIFQNKDFVVAEVYQYLIDNYNANYTYDKTKCERDYGIILTGVANDIALGTNYNAVTSGLAYTRANASIVTSAQAELTTSAFNYLKTATAALTDVAADATALARSNAAFDEVIDIFTNGSGNADALSFPSPTGVDTDVENAVAQLIANRSFLQAEITAWIADQVAAETAPFTSGFTYDSTACERDVGYIIDALCYDVLYGGNSATVQSARAYFVGTLSQLGAGESDETVAAFTQLKTIVGYAIEENTGWTPSQVVVSQDTAGTAGTATQTAITDGLVDIINSVLTLGSLDEIPVAEMPDISFAAQELQDAYADVNTNRYILTNASTTYIDDQIIRFSRTACERDVGYIVDSVKYDLTYGGNVTTRQAAIAYYSQLTDALQIDSDDKTATLAAYGVMNTILQAIASDDSYTPLQSDVTRITGTTGTGATATIVDGLISDIIDYIDDPDTNPITETTPSTSSVSSDLVAQNALLQSNKATLQSAITDFITENYSNLSYDSDTCERDVGYIVDAIGTDLMFGSNYRSVRAGISYYQAQASAVLGTQKRATLQSFRELKDLVVDILTPGAVGLASAKHNMDIIIDIIDKGVGVTPEIVGTMNYLNDVGSIHASEVLRANKTFLENEATAWIKHRFSGVVTSITSNVITTFEPHNLSAGDPIVFTNPEIDIIVEEVSSTTNTVTLRSTDGIVPGMKFIVDGGVGNINTGTEYYISSVENRTTVKISESVNGPVFDPGTIEATTSGIVAGLWGDVEADTQYYISTVTSAFDFTIKALKTDESDLQLADSAGYMKVSYAFNEDACRRDMGSYVTALVNDLQYPGNYNATYAARLYTNAIIGSAHEDMFWVSNSTGLRNCTLRGLSGDLTASNDFGTKRPTAGAFVALNPGFGPNDESVWVSARSHYSQNVTMFGAGCSGAKIDSALHNGGNKSMVKNDFTTIISDGIGVWCTGADSLTELVSVFNYYGYAGYIAEKGGRIRATNGNSSYGTYGVIAEGVSSKETPIYANLDARAAQAQIGETLTDGVSEVLRTEFTNAGTGYTNASIDISGAGYNAAAIGDEFRDGAVFETRIIDLDNATEVGGSDFVTAASSAQGGDTTSITIAATDQALSAAYIGMRIQILAGTGKGQYANIATYETGSKVATVVKESDGTAGWDHVVPGTPIVNNLDLTTSYIIEPRISYSAPGFGSGVYNSPEVFTAATYGDEKYVGLSASGSKYATTGYDWTDAGALSATATWTDVVYGGGFGATATAVVGGLGGQGAQFEAVLGVPNTTGAATDDQIASVNIIDGGQGYTTPPVIVFESAVGGQGAVATCQVLDGKIYSVTVLVPGTGYSELPTVTAATDRVTHIVINTSGRNYYNTPTVSITGGGTPSTAAEATASLQNAGVYTIEVTEQGAGYTSTPTVEIVDTAAAYVAIANGSGDNCYTTRAGIASASAWTAGTSTGKTDLESIAYGKGVYVAVGGTDSAISSTNGNLWLNRTIPTLSSGNYSAVAYGPGMFLAIASGSDKTAVSNAGVTWAAGADMPLSTTWGALAYGNGRFVAIETGASSEEVAVSYDQGASWVNVQMPSIANWTAITYGQGVFMAVSDGSIAATSPDGITWTQRSVWEATYTSIAFGNINSEPVFIGVSNGDGFTIVRTGATAQGRLKVTSGLVTETRMIEPGSGYPKGTVTSTTTGTNLITVDNTRRIIDQQPIEFFGTSAGGLIEEQTYYVIGSSITSTQFEVAASVADAIAETAVSLTSTAPEGMTYRAGPIVTVTDPNNVDAVGLRVRLGDGAIANPSFTNRGVDNTTATADVIGDGYSDLYQVSTFVNVNGLAETPIPGSNVEFASIPGKYFKLVTVTNYVENLDVPGTYTATLQLNPSLTTLNAPRHGDAITIRNSYSQVRLTGHDYLYIGTGNYERTNYPNVDITLAVQANQELFSGGGRVFFTSTDQDGNFNVGDLFGVQQATGTATLNASAFNLSGLNSLQLGSVELGIGSAVITQFSTDPFFTADSDSIVPTQRAIKSYITSQIGGGQSSLNVNTLTSGVIYVAGNSISTTTGEAIDITSRMNFTGGITGAPVALGYFMTR